jgi:short-subunit dehydrogenase
MKLYRQTILLTGASSGIGAELARQLAERDCRLILVARREALLRQLAAELKGGEERHRVYPCDLGDPAAVAALCEMIQREENSLDGMILNAGIGGGFNAAAMKMEEMRFQIEVNFWGVVQFIARLLPGFLQKRAGFIAVTSSLAGYRGMPASAPYSAAKSAVTRFVESTRIDCLGSGVHFAVISPGFVRTPMVENGRFIRPFMISAEKAARIIIRGLEKKKYEIRFPWPMVLLALFGQSLPEGMYVRLLHNRRKPTPA